MIARNVSGAAVLVCEQRALAGVLAERALSATVHVLDDGFQHLALARDLDLVLVTPDDLEDRPVPFGRLREPVAALAHADAMVIDAGDDDPSALEARLLAAAYRWPSTPRQSPTVFTLRRLHGNPLPLEPGRSLPVRENPVVAVAGIAQPTRFFAALASGGWTVLETVAFADHHQYTPRDLARIADVVKRTGASGVLTTAKDAVRLLPMRPLPVPMACVPLDAAIEPATTFREWLFGRLHEARR